MPRRLSNSLAALSLLLCLTAITTWFASYHWSPWCGYRHWSQSGVERGAAIKASDGRLLVSYMRDDYSMNPPRTRADMRVVEPPGLLYGADAQQRYIDQFGLDWQSWSFEIFRWNEPDRKGQTTRVICPLWFLTALLSTTPALALWRSRRPQPAGICANCHYNLTANTSGTCPECGTPVPRNPHP